jgi:hypothetical protein
LLEAAVARDPAFALAWAALSEAYAVIAWDTRYSDMRSYAAKARDAAQKAVALGADLPEARYARGNVALRLDFDFPLAVRELEYATSQSPGNAELQQTLGLAYRYAGRWADSARAHQREFDLEPTSIRAAVAAYSALFALGKTEEANAIAVRMSTLYPDDYSAARWVAQTAVATRADLAPLIDFVRARAADFAPNAEWVEDRWLVGMASGDFAAALAAIDDTPSDALPDFSHTMRGDALRWLGRNEEARAAYAAERDALLASLEADRDPYVEATLRAKLAYVQARLDQRDEARRNIAKADALWGVAREPSDGGKIWHWLMPALVALGDHEEALAKLAFLAKPPSYFPAAVIWTGWETAELHQNAAFRDLMRQHGVDVDREPFAFNRATVPDSGK